MFAAACGPRCRCPSNSDPCPCTSPTARPAPPLGPPVGKGRQRPIRGPGQRAWARTSVFFLPSVEVAVPVPARAATEGVTSYDVYRAVFGSTSCGSCTDIGSTAGSITTYTDNTVRARKRTGARGGSTQAKEMLRQQMELLVSLSSSGRALQNNGVGAVQPTQRPEIRRLQDGRSKVSNRKGSRHRHCRSMELRVYSAYIHCWRLVHGHGASFSFRK